MHTSIYKLEANFRTKFSLLRRYAVCTLGKLKTTFREWDFPANKLVCRNHPRETFLPLCSGCGCRSSARRCWKCLSRILSFLFLSFFFLSSFSFFTFFLLFCLCQFFWLFPHYFFFICVHSLSFGPWTILVPGKQIRERSDSKISLLRPSFETRMRFPILLSPAYSLSLKPTYCLSLSPSSVSRINRRTQANFCEFEIKDFSNSDLGFDRVSTYLSFCKSVLIEIFIVLSR